MANVTDWSALSLALNASGANESELSPLGDEMEPQFYSCRYRIVGTLFQGAVLLAGVLGNAMVMLAVKRTPALRSPTHCYLLQFFWRRLMRSLWQPMETRDGVALSCWRKKAMWALAPAFSLKPPSPPPPLPSGWLRSIGMSLGASLFRDKKCRGHGGREKPLWQDIEAKFKELKLL